MHFFSSKPIIRYGTDRDGYRGRLESHHNTIYVAHGGLKEIKDIYHIRTLLESRHSNWAERTGELEVVVRAWGFTFFLFYFSSFATDLLFGIYVLPFGAATCFFSLNHVLLTGASEGIGRN